MADYSWVGPAVQAGAGVLGEYMSKQSKGKQQQILQQAIDEFGNIDPPTLERIIAEQEGPSAFDSIRPDPDSIEAQHAALDALKGISDSGGLTLADQANLNRTRNNAASVASAGRGRIADQMAATGSLNSGNQLAMQLAGNEGAGNRASQEGMDIAGMAQKRALDAVMQRGQLAGQVRGQDFTEQSRKAEAKDLIARYNTDARSKAGYYNAGLGQQGYDNQLKRAAGMTGQLGGMANYWGDEAQSTRDLAHGLGTAGSRAVTAYNTPSTQASPLKASSSKPQTFGLDDEAEAERQRRGS